MRNRKLHNDTMRTSNTSTLLTSGEQMPTEEHKVSGKNLLDRVKQIIHEGNVRRITIKNAEGKSVLEIPLTIGVVGVVLLPVWAAVAGVAALASDYTLVVERTE